MKKTFRELQTGDKVYVVNEGTSVGYIRIEEYILEEPLTEYPEKIKGTYIARQKDCSYPLIIHESLLNESSCGFIFTTLEDAVEMYVNKSKEIQVKLKKKYLELIDEFNNIWSINNIISNNIEED